MTPWNKGIKTGPLPEQTRRRMSESHKGKKKPWASLNGFGTRFGKVPAWNKGLVGFRAGEKRPQVGLAISDGWKKKIFKRITPELELLRKGIEYKRWRAAVFERDNYTCRRCGARSETGKLVVLNADHIKPFARFPQLRFEVSNGRTLCVGCHKKTDTYGNGGRRTGKKAELVAGS